MNPIKHKIKEQGDRFEEKFINGKYEHAVGVDDPMDVDELWDDVQSFFHQSQHELLDTIVSVLDGEKTIGKLADYNEDGFIDDFAKGVESGHNGALDHAIQLLKQGKE